jgi:CRP-like cAMP-binding protein
VSSKRRTASTCAKIAWLCNGSRRSREGQDRASEHDADRCEPALYHRRPEWAEASHGQARLTRAKLEALVDDLIQRTVPPFGPNYLGVSVETVSRALSDLKQRGVIKLLGTRTVQILHRDLLQDGNRDAH